MRNMSRGAAVVLLVAGLAACGEGTFDARAEDRLTDAAADATDALGSVTDLEDRFDAEIARLESAADRTARATERLTARLDQIAGKMTRALERLEASVKDVRGTVAGASSSASSALAEAQAAAQELALLQERYEYHLRRYHGGG